MDGPPDDRCGYAWPENRIGQFENQQSCCYRKTTQNSDRCIWHAYPDEVGDKSIQELQQARAPPEIREVNSPYAELLDGAQLQGLKLSDSISFEDTALRDANLSNARLHSANFSGAMLFKANLSDSSLINADLSNTFLESADLAGTGMLNVDLTNAHLDITTLNDVSLWSANLTNASLQEVVFDDVTLYGATLKGNDMKYIEIEEVEVNKDTTVGRQVRAEKDAESDNDWDLIAQAYHEWKTVFIDHGFVGKARDLHVLERRARGLEAKAASNRLDGWLNPTYLGSLLSRIFTGYGIRVRYLLFWMTTLFLFSTAWYTVSGIEETLVGNFTFSVITFTTSPPRVPSGFWTQIVVMFETFFGTLAIVLLGYILGNREY